MHTLSFSETLLDYPSRVSSYPSLLSKFYNNCQIKCEKNHQNIGAPKVQKCPKITKTTTVLIKCRCIIWTQRYPKVQIFPIGCNVYAVAEAAAFLHRTGSSISPFLKEVWVEMGIDKPFFDCWHLYKMNIFINFSYIFCVLPASGSSKNLDQHNSRSPLPKKISKWSKITNKHCYYQQSGQKWPLNQLYTLTGR